MLRLVVKMFLLDGQYRKYFCKEVGEYLKGVFANEPTEMTVKLRMLQVAISAALVVSMPFCIVVSIYERDTVGLGVEISGAIFALWCLNWVLDLACLVKTANEEALRHSSRK